MWYYVYPAMVFNFLPSLLRAHQCPELGSSWPHCQQNSTIWWPGYVLRVSNGTVRFIRSKSKITEPTEPIVLATEDFSVQEILGYLVTVPPSLCATAAAGACQALPWWPGPNHQLLICCHHLPDTSRHFQIFRMKIAMFWMFAWRLSRKWSLETLIFPKYPVSLPFLWKYCILQERNCYILWKHLKKYQRCSHETENQGCSLTVEETK